MIKHHSLPLGEAGMAQFLVYVGHSIS
jgi:hypothetical protein